MNVHRPELKNLIDRLRNDYETSPRGEKMTALHRFGIEHASALADLDRADLEAVASAAGSASFATELRKMIKLARHVRLQRVETREEPLSAVFLRHARDLPKDFIFDREEANAR